MAKGTGTVDLEAGRPTADQALVRLRGALATFRRQGIRRVRIIHGYGSTGTGGAIRQAVRAALPALVREGRARAYCAGEAFGPFDEAGRSLLALEPAFRNEPDWGRGNEGITLVLL